MELKRSWKNRETANVAAFNCTLWNWNENEIQQIPPIQTLLIVPYGIETRTADILNFMMIIF